MAGYSSCLIDNFASLTNPLRLLMHKDQEWQWTDEHEKTFQKVKRSLSQETKMTHYDPK